MASADNPRILVFGAGAVGCFIGGAWKAAGLDVHFAGRERLQREIGEYGLTLTDQNGWKAVFAAADIDYQTKPQALRQADIVLLTVKTVGIEAAAKEIAKHARPGTRVLSFQNGVTAAERLKKLLPGQQVLHGMVPFNVVRLGPGRWHRATFGELVAEASETTRALAARIGDQPGKLLLADDMRGVAWGKLLYNPDASPAAWRHALEAEHGADAGAAEIALSHASRILPLMTSAHLPSASNHALQYEMAANMPIVPDGAVPEASQPA